MISILVAVFNAESTLRRTLDSLLSQTMEDWQAICIDDCSTDASLAILREYASRDSRFLVVPLQTNHGQAYARNQGLTFAQGDYIGFLDSDDWLANDALEQVAVVFSQYPLTDCVLFDCRYVDAVTGSIRQYEMTPFGVKTGREAFLDSLTWAIHGVYVVRREIHLRYPYDESCRSYSDDNTTRLHYYTSREVRCCNGQYFYLQHADSVTHRDDASHINFLLSTVSMKQSLLELGVGEDILNIHETQTWLRLIDCYMFWYRHRNLHFGRQLHEFWKKMEMNRVDAAIRCKFGYRHCSSWWLFRFQEETYFFLRSLLRRG